MRIRLLAIYILALLCVCGHAESTPRWLEITRPHFSIMSAANEKQARHAARSPNACRTLLSTIGQSSFSSAPPKPSTPTCDEACQQARQNVQIQRKLEWFTGGLVVVGFFQVMTMIWQGILLARTRTDVHNQGIRMGEQVTQMKEQGAATLRSVLLQEVQYKQWVVIGFWETKTRHIQPNVTEAVLTLKFEVGNQTKFPLTLKKLTTGRRGKESASSGLNYTIPPEDSYLASYSFNATPEELQLYRQNNLEVTLSIETEITDVLERDNPPQHFTHTITFGPTRCDAVEQPHHWQLLIKQTS